MSQNGHLSFGLPPEVGAIVVGRFELAPGGRFDWHEHPAHQLAWCARGVLAVSVGDSTWVLPPARALWVPAGVVHAVEASRPATMKSVYFRTQRCPIRWASPTVVAVSPLARELIDFLADGAPEPRAREHASRLLLELLCPLGVTPIELVMPTDGRALRVAQALAANPADERTLSALGRAAGASARTLARLFLSETGSSFGQWRTHLRLRAALVHMAAGQPVTAVAERVGYQSPSAFVAAFRRLLGVPPGAYFAGQHGD